MSVEEPGPSTALHNTKGSGANASDNLAEAPDSTVASASQAGEQSPAVPDLTAEQAKCSRDQVE